MVKSILSISLISWFVFLGPQSLWAQNRSSDTEAGFGCYNCENKVPHCDYVLGVRTSQNGVLNAVKNYFERQRGEIAKSLEKPGDHCASQPYCGLPDPLKSPDFRSRFERETKASVTAFTEDMEAKGGFDEHTVAHPSSPQRAFKARKEALSNDESWKQLIFNDLCPQVSQLKGGGGSVEKKETAHLCIEQMKIRDPLAFDGGVVHSESKCDKSSGKCTVVFQINRMDLQGKLLARGQVSGDVVGDQNKLNMSIDPKNPIKLKFDLKIDPSGKLRDLVRINPGDLTDKLGAQHFKFSGDERAAKFAERYFSGGGADLLQKMVSKPIQDWADVNAGGHSGSSLGNFIQSRLGVGDGQRFGVKVPRCANLFRGYATKSYVRSVAADRETCKQMESAGRKRNGLKEAIARHKKKFADNVSSPGAKKSCEELKKGFQDYREAKAGVDVLQGGDLRLIEGLDGLNRGLKGHFLIGNNDQYGMIKGKKCKIDAKVADSALDSGDADFAVDVPPKQALKLLNEAFGEAFDAISKTKRGKPKTHIICRNTKYRADNCPYLDQVELSEVPKVSFIPNRDGSGSLGVFVKIKRGHPPGGHKHKLGMFESVFAGKGGYCHFHARFSGQVKASFALTADAKGHLGVGLQDIHTGGTQGTKVKGWVAAVDNSSRLNPKLDSGCRGGLERSKYDDHVDPTRSGDSIPEKHKRERTGMAVGALKKALGKKFNFGDALNRKLGNGLQVTKVSLNADGHVRVFVKNKTLGVDGESPNPCLLPPF